MARKVGVLSVKRRARLATEVAPLVAQGVGLNGIAEKLGISVSTASHDVSAVKQIWAEALKEDIHEVRATAVAEFDYLAREAIEGWNHSKREGRPSDKLLNAAANCLERRNRLMGLGLDINVVNNQLNVHGEATNPAGFGRFRPHGCQTITRHSSSRKGPHDLIAANPRQGRRRGHS